MGELVRDRSSTLFPKASDRLSILAGIARLDDPAQFSTKELAESLHLPEPKVSKELAKLRAVGLIERTPPGSPSPLRRVSSGFWAGCKSLHEEWSSQEEAEKSRRG